MRATQYVALRAMQNCTYLGSNQYNFVINHIEVSCENAFCDRSTVVPNGDCILEVHLGKLYVTFKNRGEPQRDQHCKTTLDHTS